MTTGKGRVLFRDSICRLKLKVLNVFLSHSDQFFVGLKSIPASNFKVGDGVPLDGMPAFRHNFNENYFDGAMNKY